MKCDHRQFVALLVVTCFVFYIQYVFQRSSHFPNSFPSRTELTYRSYNATVLAYSVPVIPRSALCTSYDGASQNFSTQDIIVRAAYFDDRPRGNHRNSTVILIEVRISILKQNLIVGCAVGEHATTDKHNFGVHKLKLTNWVHKYDPKLSHDTVFVDCFDVPVVQNGSRAFVLYKRSANDSTITCVESDRPLMIPAPYRPPAKNHNFSVELCCAPIFGTPVLLTE